MNHRSTFLVAATALAFVVAATSRAADDPAGAAITKMAKECGKEHECVLRALRFYEKRLDIALRCNELVDSDRKARCNALAQAYDEFITDVFLSQQSR